jgi:ubiquitin-activating enzyme E1
VIVLTDVSLSLQLAVNDFTHAHGIKFISCDTRGLFGQVFCDFGPEFIVNDVTGEQPLTGMIASITLVTSSYFAVFCFGYLISSH